MRQQQSALGWVAALAVFAVTADAQAAARRPRAEPAPGAAATAPGARTVSQAPKPAAGAGRPAVTRADRPVFTAMTTGAGQTGYVHFFLMRLPDDTLEVQLGVELPDQRIAWSFPELGATVSPFIDVGMVQAGGKDYEIWHLYGIRPFPDDAAMRALQKQLPDRVRPLVEAKAPYCENDGPGSRCMSCLGFVLRALFPRRADGYPVLPADLARAGIAGKYTTRDLLLYLTGMLELPTRAARLQRIERLMLPDDLREDLEDFVYAMGIPESSATGSSATQRGPAQKRPGPRPSRLGARPVPRGSL